MCVRHFDFYKLLKSNLMNENILSLVRFWPEKISAVTDPGPEHFRLDRTNTNKPGQLIFHFTSAVVIVVFNQSSVSSSIS